VQDGSSREWREQQSQRVAGEDWSAVCEKISALIVRN
jgi:hypothetical protein